MAGPSFTATLAHRLNLLKLTTEPPADAQQSMDIDEKPPSICSYHSSENGSDIRYESYGRMMSSTNYTYGLPVDVPEHQRQDTQHHYLTLALDSLHASYHAVQTALRPRLDGQPCRVADMGSGSGIWAIEMALEFPDVDVVGIDAVPPYNSKPIPQNCRFEIDDANLRFPHYYKYFDVVHARHCALGIRDYTQFIHELTRMLRPGGILLLVEPELEMYSADRIPLSINGGPGSKDFSWLQYLSYATRTALQARGGTIDAHSIIRPCLRTAGLFDQTANSTMFIQVGERDECHSPIQKQIAHLAYLDLLSTIYSVRPLLLEHADKTGTPHSTVDGWIKNADAEVRQPGWMCTRKWHFGWAKRAAG